MSESEPGRLAGKTILFSGTNEVVADIANDAEQAGAKVLWWGSTPSAAPGNFEKKLKINPNNWESVERAMAIIRKKYGHLHGAVNVIDYVAPGTFLESDPNDWLQIGKLLRSTSIQMKSQIGKMLETGGGRVFNVLGMWDRYSAAEEACYTCLWELTNGAGFDYEANGVFAIPICDVSEFEIADELLMERNVRSQPPYVGAVSFGGTPLEYTEEFKELNKLDDT